MRRIAAIAALLLVTTGAQASEIITNGGFETGDLSGWYYGRALPGNPFAANWYVNSFAFHSGNYSAATGDNYELRQNFAPVLVGDIGSITFSAMIGPGYPMAFDLFYQGGADQEFAVTTSGAGFSTFNITSYLDMSQTALTGISFWGNIVTSAFLDDVSIQSRVAPPPPGVPEPLTLALFGAGLAGLGALRRKRAR
jgi:hypothetical protein